MGGKKKGLSFDEKKQKLLEIFYSKKDVFTFKELEKLAPKVGIIPQSVKEVLDSLVADGLVESDKIGAGNFYWSFPSKAMQKRIAMSEDISAKITKANEDGSKISATIEQQKSLRELNPKREEGLKAIQEISHKNEELKQELSKYERLDAGRCEEMKANIKKSDEERDNWESNIFSIIKYTKKMDSNFKAESLYEEFPLLRLLMES